MNRFLDIEAQEDDGIVEDEEEDDEDNLGGFIFDDDAEINMETRSTRTLPAITSALEDAQEAHKYVSALRRRHERWSDAPEEEDYAQQPSLLFMISVPAGAESRVAANFKEAVEIEAMEGVRVHHLPLLPRRLYVEGPSLCNVQRLMKYSQSTYHGRGIRLIDDVDREWLQGENISFSLPVATWVKITDRGLYYNDLALVVESPRHGDLVTLAVVPRFSPNGRKRRRKGTRPGPVLLDAKSLSRLSFKENFYRSGSRRFHPSGLEFLLAPAAHTLKPESNPSEEQLRPYELSISLHTGSQISHDIDWLLLDAVKSAYQRIVRETWRVGDRIRICDGEFINWQAHLVEIDSSSQSAIVSVLDPKSLDTFQVAIVLANLERYFRIGDVVRVVIGMEKGRKGSITSIENDEVATIVDLSSGVVEFKSNLAYLESHIPDPVSLQTHVSSITAQDIRTQIPNVSLAGHRLGTRNVDSRIGKYAAVISGEMKGWQGRLIRLTDKTATIECAGSRLQPEITDSLKNFVLIEYPDFNLAGRKLETPYVGRSLMRPLTPPPRSSTPPSLFPAAEAFEDVPDNLGTAASEAFEDVPQGHGTGAFLRDPSICGNLENYYIWVGFNSTYERGSYLKRTGYTPLSGRFNDCADNEVVVAVSDHRTSLHHSRKVQLHYLVPASPLKKGDYVILLSGDNQGHVSEVVQCQKKERKVKIIINNQRLTYDFAQVCRLTKVL